MYVWLWRRLRGPLPLRVLQAAALLGVTVAALFVWVFPAVEARLPYQDVTVPVDPSPSPAPTSSAGAPAVPGELPGEEVSPTAPGVVPSAVPNPSPSAVP